MLDIPIFGRSSSIKISHICIIVLAILNTAFQLNSYYRSDSNSRATTSITGSDTVGNHITTNSNQNNDELLVQYGDSIYTKNNWDGAPIVIEEHKLLFFSSAKVGCTTWKQLFRRIMNISNYTVEEYDTLLPWNPEINGLRYLYHYNRSTATAMMTDPSWTRAIFVRDPKERFLSAYLDKVIQNNEYIVSKCCPYSLICGEKAKESISNFINIMYICSDSHWNPQSKRIMEDKYWPYINYVGHMENIFHDAKILLQQIGAWEEYGQSGWGPTQTDALFQAKLGGNGRMHATDAASKLSSYITPGIETIIEQYYADDYNNMILNITLQKIHKNIDTTAKNEQKTR